uniref:polyphosphoinositide phosphatase isoform X1 n=1 Tax=Myxine glutinosa TaxID=7769 RepID=UPI00358F8A78
MVSALPLISCIQKLVLYETKARFYLVGSNNAGTKFRILKIDRTEPLDLVITDDQHVYSNREIQDLLGRLDGGNRARNSQKTIPGISPSLSAYGILGFVRFLEGYYAVLVTRRRRVAELGGHAVYRVEDTSMVYLPSDTTRVQHPEEHRYVKIFQNVDLSSNFYFSYSYDLTHSLQHNVRQLAALGKTFTQQVRLSGDQDAGTGVDPVVIGARGSPCWKFVWNKQMLTHGSYLHYDWCLHIIHGFCAQSKLVIYGRPVYVTLLARRSCCFAGTRFLKRGANSQGEVANEVETEQLVHDASVSSLAHGMCSSFVQHRGSLPLHWSQDTSSMIPKPPITLDQADPFAYIPGLHFSHMLQRFGSPLIILNLVKRHECRRHESLLSGELGTAVSFLNQFLPPEHRIVVISWDMARHSKRKQCNVLDKLHEIAERVVRKTGFFVNRQDLDHSCLHVDERWTEIGGVITETSRLQTGVVRTNCVDCLDRTNTAQFVVGKCALAYQLYALGLLHVPTFELDTDAARLLEELYEDHGDTLALQYGGSHLVHRVRTYRKIAPWTSHSRDILQTLSRYYNNTFSDAEKQDAINLFLGVFRPSSTGLQLWDLTTDYYLHHPPHLPLSTPSFTCWWSPKALSSLPLPYDEEEMDKKAIIKVMVKGEEHGEDIDLYSEFVKPHQLTSFDKAFPLVMTSSSKDFTPKTPGVNASPFVVRKFEDSGKQVAISSRSTDEACVHRKTAASAPPCPAEEGDSSSDDEGSGSEGEDESSVSLRCSPARAPAIHQVPPTTIKGTELPSRHLYGVDLSLPLAHDDQITYSRYSVLGRQKAKMEQQDVLGNSKPDFVLYPVSNFPQDSVFEAQCPFVSSLSSSIYHAHVQAAMGNLQPLSPADLLAFCRHTKQICP